MPPVAVPVTLTASERKTLKKRVRGAKTPWRDRLRARVVLAAARGHRNTRIAADLGCDAGTVRKWRGRFAGMGLAGLEDKPRPGRPRAIPGTGRAAVVALACQLPADTGVPLSRWTGPELAAGLVAQRLARAKVILDLCQGFYQGERLAEGDRILSFDAKPPIQARGRVHATLPAAPGRVARAEHEYVRHGALALLAGLDVRTGQVFASTPRTTGIVPFTDLATLLAFVARYNRTAQPFSWKYTAGDLKDLLHRISEHEKQDTIQQTGLAMAA